MKSVNKFFLSMLFFTFLSQFADVCAMEPARKKQRMGAVRLEVSEAGVDTAGVDTSAFDFLDCKNLIEPKQSLNLIKAARKIIEIIKRSGRSHEPSIQTVVDALERSCVASDEREIYIHCDKLLALVDVHSIMSPEDQAFFIVLNLDFLRNRSITTRIKHFFYKEHLVQKFVQCIEDSKFMKLFLMSSHVAHNFVLKILMFPHACSQELGKLLVDFKDQICDLLSKPGQLGNKMLHSFMGKLVQIIYKHRSFLISQGLSFAWSYKIYLGLSVVNFFAGHYGLPFWLLVPAATWTWSSYFGDLSAEGAFERDINAMAQNLRSFSGGGGDGRQVERSFVEPSACLIDLQKRELKIFTCEEISKHLFCSGPLRLPEPDRIALTQQIFEKIKILDLAHNHLSSEALVSLSHLPTLESLSVKNNELKNLHFLKELRKLKILDISDNKLVLDCDTEQSRDSVESLCNCASLVKCFVAGNQLRDEVKIILVDAMPLLIEQNIRISDDQWRGLQEEYKLLNIDEPKAIQEKKRLAQEKYEKECKEVVNQLVHRVKAINPAYTLYNFFNSLGDKKITQLSEIQEIKKNYKKLVLQFHPDKVNQSLGQDKKKELEEQFRLLHDIYELFCDAQKKHYYDTEFVG